MGGILLNQVGNALATFLGPVVLMESEGAELLDAKEALWIFKGSFSSTLCIEADLVIRWYGLMILPLLDGSCYT